MCTVYNNSSVKIWNKSVASVTQSCAVSMAVARCVDVGQAYAPNVEAEIAKIWSQLDTSIRRADKKSNRPANAGIRPLATMLQQQKCSHSVTYSTHILASFFLRFYRRHMRRKAHTQSAICFKVVQRKGWSCWPPRISPFLSHALMVVFVPSRLKYTAKAVWSRILSESAIVYSINYNARNIHTLNV